MPRRGVIYTVAPSYKDVNTIWAGTDDGLIHVTRDGGKSWQNVTPPELKSWAKVSLIDAGRFDANTAYAAINTFRLDDLRPHIYRTHDGGKTWKEIVKGIARRRHRQLRSRRPDAKGLLFCGTEQAVYFSIDDGENWQPLRLNMPATSIRDLVIQRRRHCRRHARPELLDSRRYDSAAADQLGNRHDGRYSSLRRSSQRASNAVFIPTRRSRPRNLPDKIRPMEPIINYYLKAKSSTPVVLEISRSAGKFVRRFASDDKPLDVDVNKLRFPTYWARPRRSEKRAGNAAFCVGPDVSKSAVRRL